MKNKLLSLLFLIHFSSGYSQSSDSTATFRLFKQQEFLYQGVDSTIRNWYFFIDVEKKAYMANLFIPEEEILDWFKKRKNSNNIFKSISKVYDNDTLIHLSKENEPDIILEFQLEKKDEDFFLKSTQNETIYHFRRMNIQ